MRLKNKRNLWLPCTMPFMNSKSNLDFGEHRWIIDIQRYLDEDTDPDESDSIKKISIFTIPKTIILTSPQHYAPQLVGLSPYHHFRIELRESEFIKIHTARRARKQHAGFKFHPLVVQLLKFDPIIRHCYDKQLRFDGETLAWMMAINSCFILQFLADQKWNSQLSRWGYDSVIRDIIMLENQIPLFLLKKTGDSLFQSSEDFLYTALMGFFEQISPFKRIKEQIEDHDILEIMDSDHILDFIYKLIVPKHEELARESTDKCDKKSISWLMPIRFIKKLVVSRPVKCIFKLFLRLIFSIPGLILFKQLEYIFFNEEKSENRDRDNMENRAVLMEEATIPSVTELWTVGVRFLAIDSGLSGIKFDGNTATLHLPVISLDINSEVVLSNLVAYESCITVGPLVLTRYIELINGLIDTWEDAKILREQGILLNHLRSDEEAAKLWNSMSELTQLTKLPFLDTVIQEVNEYYYQRRRRVRIGNLFDRKNFQSWQMIIMLIVVLMMIIVNSEWVLSLVALSKMK